MARTMSSSAPVLVRVLDEDADLGASLGPERLAAARLQAIAPLIAIGSGEWEPPSTPGSSGQDLGLLLLKGVLRRDLELAGRTFSELRGPDDLLRPWDDVAEVGSVRGRITWCALEPTRLAWLDGDFAEAIAPWPEIGATLIERATRRARLLSFRLAIGELEHVHLRVLLLLWHLSDRWGRVGADGVRLDLRLSHELIGRMVGAHRTSVTLAVQRLSGEGRIARREDGGWLLLGEPPADVSDVRGGA